MLGSLGAAGGMQDAGADAYNQQASSLGSLSADPSQLAGGTGAGEVKIFSRGQQSVVGAMACEGGVYGVDFSNAGGMLAVAGGDTSIRICRVPRVEKLR